MTQQTLTISKENAPAMIAEFIKLGLTFEAVERDGDILINFTGGY